MDIHEPVSAEDASFFSSGNGNGHHGGGGGGASDGSAEHGLPGAGLGGVWQILPW